MSTGLASNSSSSCLDSVKRVGKGTLMEGVGEQLKKETENGPFIFKEKSLPKDRGNGLCCVN